MKLVLHHCHDARSVRTAWLLEEMGLAYDLVVHEFGPDLQTSDYLSKSPAGRVPCLEIDGEPVIESGAIAEILCEEIGTPLFRPPGHPERRKWLQWLHFAETIGQHLAILTQHHIVLYPEARSPGVMKLERRRLEKSLGAIDAALQRQDYLLGSGFSAVDIHVGYAVHVASHFAGLDHFPRTRDYHARLASRPAFAGLQPPAGAMRIYRQPFYDLPVTAPGS